MLKLLIVPISIPPIIRERARFFLSLFLSFSFFLLKGKEWKKGNRKRRKPYAFYFIILSNLLQPWSGYFFMVLEGEMRLPLFSFFFPSSFLFQKEFFSFLFPFLFFFPFLKEGKEEEEREKAFVFPVFWKEKKEGNVLSIFLLFLSFKKKEKGK